jgi:hypothetical protein
VSSGSGIGGGVMWWTGSVLDDSIQWTRAALSCEIDMHCMLCSYGLVLQVHHLTNKPAALHAMKLNSMRQTISVLIQHAQSTGKALQQHLIVTPTHTETMPIKRHVLLCALRVHAGQRRVRCSLAQPHRVRRLVQQMLFEVAHAVLLGQ